MPLIRNEAVFTKAKLGIWRFTEPEEFFMDQLQLNNEEKLLVLKMTPKKRLEWLSSRHLIHLMSGRTERAIILKDIYGKPYLKDSAHHISFSHSNQLSAVIAATEPVGIDIQVIVPKITRIGHKFMNEPENNIIHNNNPSYHIELLHIIWGAKESLYKAYGKRSLDFKKDLLVDHLYWNGKFTNFTGTIQKEQYYATFNLAAEKINNYILVYAKASQ